MGILLSNLFGYRLVGSWLESRADHVLEARLDRQQYAESDLVAVSVPLGLPYFNSQSRAERTSGVVVMNGKQYRFVKRMVRNDSLIIWCIADHAKTQLDKARNDFFKQVSGIQHPGKQRQAGVFKRIADDYYTVDPVSPPRFVIASPGLPRHESIAALAGTRPGAPERPPAQA